MLAALLLGTSGCAHFPSQNLDSYLDEYWGSRPEPSRFAFCYSHGCSVRREVGLDENEWNEVKVIFTPRPATAEGERQSIGRAIAYLETVVGRKTGTDVDRGGSTPGTFMKNQLDCVDEMLNTGAYLTMMKNDGLIAFHELREPAQRGNFIHGWPHVAITIIEHASGKAYVVDSWFYDNGQPPVIILLEDWMRGWKPYTGK